MKTKQGKITKLLKEKLKKGEISKFYYLVYDFVKTIPKGKTTTYKEVAIAIGCPKAYRAVGNALNKNPEPSYSADRQKRGGLRAGQVPIPCHRVIRSDGTLGGFARGSQKKLQLLRGELQSTTSRRG